MLNALSISVILLTCFVALTVLLVPCRGCQRLAKCIIFTSCWLEGIYFAKIVSYGSDDNCSYPAFDNCWWLNDDCSNIFGHWCHVSHSCSFKKIKASAFFSETDVSIFYEDPHWNSPLCSVNSQGPSFQFCLFSQSCKGRWCVTEWLWQPLFPQLAPMASLFPSFRIVTVF